MASKFAEKNVWKVFEHELKIFLKTVWKLFENLLKILKRKTLETFWKHPQNFLK